MRALQTSSAMTKVWSYSHKHRALVEDELIYIQRQAIELTYSSVP